MAPMPSGGLLYNDVMTGNMAASVLPLLVPAEMRMWSSHPLKMSNALVWISLNEPHLLL